MDSWAENAAVMPMLTVQTPITPDPEMDFTCPSVMDAPDWDTQAWDTPDFAINDYSSMAFNDPSMPQLTGPWIKEQYQETTNVGSTVIGNDTNR